MMILITKESLGIIKNKTKELKEIRINTMTVLTLGIAIITKINKITETEIKMIANLTKDK
jgi:hypothetical protein